MNKKTEIVWIIMDIMYLIFILSVLVILCLHGWQWFYGIKFYGTLAVIVGFESPAAYRFFVKKRNDRRQHKLERQAFILAKQEKLNQYRDIADHLGMDVKDVMP